MKSALWMFLIWAICGGHAAIFSLTDSDPSSSEFRRRFFADHGVHESIEPQWKARDRPLREAIFPHLETNPRKAIALIEEANIQMHPAFLNLLGNLYYRIEEDVKAEQSLRLALKQFPSFRRSWRTLAMILVKRNQFEEAIPPLLKVITLGGGDAQSYGLLGYCYLAISKYESALSAYRMARMFSPDRFDFRRGQAHCLLMTQAHLPAIALFDELLQEMPDETAFWLAQANAFLALGETEKAIANLQIVADSTSASRQSLSLLGDLYLNEDLPHLAIQCYRQALIKAKPADPSAVLSSLRSLLIRGFFVEAKAYLKLLQDWSKTDWKDEDEREMQLAEARIEMAIGDADRAFPILHRAVQKDPLDGESLLLLGEYFQSKNRLDEAAFHFERAALLGEFEHKARVALGQLAVQKGRLIDAVEALKKALQINPDPNVKRYLQAIETALETKQ